MTREPMALTGDLTRRTLIIQGGLSALAIGGLSSCTNYGSGAATVPGRIDAAPAPARGRPPPSADIPVGGGKIFTDAQTVITQPKSGQFKAFTAICTHQQCTVADVTTTINCNCHGSKFSITDGSVVNGPAQNPLAAKTIAVDGDTITVA